MTSNVPDNSLNGPITTFKIITLGDSMVGKTTLRLSYIGEGFQSTYIPTMGVDFALATYKNYLLQIWDLAGQETFQSITKTMYLGSDGIIVVFDVTNRDSMLNVPHWIDGYLTIESNKVPMVVFGNKIDLRNENSIQKPEAEEFVNSLSMKYKMKIGYVETSALTGKNIKYAFEDFTDKIAAEEN